MLEKYGVNCDDCGTYHHLVGRFFSEKIQEIKDAGWKIRKFAEIWCHYCPDCQTPETKLQQPEKREHWYDQD